MIDYQQRVVDEKRELDEKRTKLNAFVGTELYRTLDLAERECLQEQSRIMYQYSLILARRIARF